MVNDEKTDAALLALLEAISNDAEVASLMENKMLRDQLFISIIRMLPELHKAASEFSSFIKSRKTTSIPKQNITRGIKLTADEMKIIANLQDSEVGTRVKFMENCDLTTREIAMLYTATSRSSKQESTGLNIRILQKILGYEGTPDSVKKMLSKKIEK